MKIIDGKNEVIIDDQLAQEVKRRCGENVFLCYQCRKCSSGCPARDFMKGSPSEFIRLVQLGQADEAMKTDTIWYCMSCQTCTARCPQGIDIAHVVDTVRIIVQEKKVKTATNNWRLFNWLWMTILHFTGRMYEVALTGAMNVFTLKPFKDIALGGKMIRNGKLKLLPSIKKPVMMFKMFRTARRVRK